MASPTDNQVVSRVREVAKRILGAGRPNRKESQRKVLEEIVEGADLSNVLQLRKVCLYVLSFAVFFFRSEEVLNIRMSHIRF